MESKYDMDDVAFANRVLNHRDTLEDGEVAAWLESGEHRVLLEEVAKVRHAAERADYGELREREWLRLSRRIKERRLRKRVVWTAGVAAAVACLLGWSIWGNWLREGVQDRELAEVAEELVPGSPKAELVLAGGERIALGKQGRNIETPALAGITDDSLKGLDYSKVAVLDEAVQEEYNILRVPVGGFYKLALPDGSLVWLNAASELRFPVQFTGKKREVYLEGEGFFEVARDTSRQFVVHVGRAEVAVLGTKFNVNAYRDEERVYTTLAEGSVAFRPGGGKREVCLRPGEQSVMEVKDGSTTVVEVDPAIYSAWIEGRFVFRAMDLETIMRQLERWYACDVFYTSEDVKHREFWGAVSRDMELRDVLDIIEETTDVRFEIKGKTVVVGKV